MGAWIETSLDNALKVLSVSHPVWVRGLKQTNFRTEKRVPLSHPVWVRGLKHFRHALCCQFQGSHPVWVRGLKLTSLLRKYPCLKVAPRVGAWIETESNRIKYHKGKVAPRVGAWIETYI